MRQRVSDPVQNLFPVAGCIETDKMQRNQEGSRRDRKCSSGVAGDFMKSSVRFLTFESASAFASRLKNSPGSLSRMLSESFRRWLAVVTNWTAVPIPSSW